MPRDLRRAFTLLELIIVVLISSSMTLVIALFLQKGVTVYTRTDDEGQLAAHVRLMMDRLRKTARHSISNFSNWRNKPAGFAFDTPETLFFLTDHDQNLDREAHFVWIDRKTATSNTAGTDRMIHCWKRVNDAVSWGAFSLSQMPPDMSATSPTFANLLAHLRSPTNFGAPGQASPTAQSGWEVLLESIPNPVPANYTIPSLPIYIAPWVSPAIGAGWGVSPSNGIAFNIDNLVTVQPGAGVTPTWGYPSVSPTLAGSLLYELCRTAPPSPTTGPYPRPASVIVPPSAAAMTVNSGSPHCQVYVRVFADRNLNYTMDSEEASVELVTSLNMLLIPSAGTPSP
jgi:prepilin-type N-terminal cleavage/methylation domain-containing protein